jgi:hypothetical protein
MTLDAFVKFCLTADGVAIGLGIALSFFAEMVPGWDSVGPVAKRWLILLMAMVIAFGATAVGVFILGQVFNAEMVFVALQAGMVGFWSSQMAHASQLKAKSRAQALGEWCIEVYREAAEAAVEKRQPFGWSEVSESIMRRVANTAYNSH